MLVAPASLENLCHLTANSRLIKRMEMLELIRRELQDFLYQRNRFTELLETERDKLEEYAAREKASQAYIGRQNRIFSTAWDFMEAAQDLVDGMATGSQILTGKREDPTANFRIQELEEENRKLKLYLKSLGKDPTLVQYMRVRDFY